MLKPVLVRAFGRTGTTLLMQLLKSSEDVFVPNEYPFESRYLSYFARMAKQPFNFKSGEGDSFKDGDVLNPGLGSLGPLPYQFSEFIDQSRFQKRLMCATWNQFSQEIQETLGRNYLYYGEKVSLDLAPFVNHNLPGVNNIFVVRDPRGELASIMSFNKKRGFNGFGWLDSDTAESFAKRMIDSRKAFLESASQFKNGAPNVLVLRFEDLVSNTHSVSEKISRHLNVKIDCDKVLAESDSYSFHMTSSGVADSGEKWRRELDPHVSDIFLNGMGEAMALFNYA